MKPPVQSRVPGKATDQLRIAGQGDSRPGCAHCGRPLPYRRRRFCSDLCRIRGQRAERVTETGDFGRAAIRMIRTMARRVGASDLATFGAMWEVRAEADRAATAAIDGLRQSGFSWAEIAAEIGWERHRLYQWWARRSREPGRSRNVNASAAEIGRPSLTIVLPPDRAQSGQ